MHQYWICGEACREEMRMDPAAGGRALWLLWLEQWSDTVSGRDIQTRGMSR